MISRYRKAIAGIVGIAGTGLSAGLVPSPENRWITAIIGLVGAAGIYTVRNVTPKAPTQSNGPPAYKA